MSTASKSVGAHLLRNPVARVFVFAFVLFLTPICAFAQSPSPAPTLKPQPTPSWEAGMPSAQMSELLIHMRELVPYIRRQVERPLADKFKTLALILSSLVLVFSFIRVLRENDGASTDLLYWMGRAAIFMVLFGLSTPIISTMYKVGRTLTTPLDNGIEERRQAFNDTYYEFVHGTMIVKDDQNVMTDPNRCFLSTQDAGSCWIAVLAGDENGNNALKTLDKLGSTFDLSKPGTMDVLFYLLNIARGILQFGEIFLLLLSGFVMIGLRLIAPFIAAVGTDKKLAERITYPFMWGTIVFTMIFPVIRDVIIYISYTVGAFGLMLYKGQPIYTIDNTTAELVKNNPYDPKFVILISLVTMTVSGLCLWLSPYIAYRFATGQVFEAVSSTASGWMSAIVGSVVEYAGLKAGASIQRQAENTQIQGSYQAEMTRARATLETSNLGAQARQLSGLASIEAGRQQAIAAVVASATGQRAQANAGANFIISGTRSQLQLSTSDIAARKTQAVTQAGNVRDAENTRIQSDKNARISEEQGKATSWIPAFGVMASTSQDWVGTKQRSQGNFEANRDLATNTQQTEIKAASSYTTNQETYQNRMERAAITQRDEQVAGINRAEGIGVGGANRGAAIASGGVKKAYQLELQANEVQFAGTKDAAGISRDANFEAARDRQVGMMLTSMSRDIARRLEEAGKQRY